jgi:hypothetical protein
VTELAIGKITKYPVVASVVHHPQNLASYPTIKRFVLLFIIAKNAE